MFGIGYQELLIIFVILGLLVSPALVAIPRRIEVGPSGAASCLVLYPKSMMQEWAERKPSIVFECASVKQTYDEMLSRGVQFTQTPTQMPWGPFAIFLDPEGNSYGLREPM
jgi:hypothetical protein